MAQRANGVPAPDPRVKWPPKSLTGSLTYGSERHMTDDIPRRYDRVEVISGVQRRRRWTPEEKVRMVEETFLPGMSVSLVARQHGVAGDQLFNWRRLMAQGALTAAGAGEEVVPASDYRALEAQVRELQRMLGKKTMENEILREAISRTAGAKKLPLRGASLPEDGQ
jgi:transposase